MAAVLLGCVPGAVVGLYNRHTLLQNEREESEIIRIAKQEQNKLVNIWLDFHRSEIKEGEFSISESSISDVFPFIPCRHTKMPPNSALYKECKAKKQAIYDCILQRENDLNKHYKKVGWHIAALLALAAFSFFVVDRLALTFMTAGSLSHRVCRISAALSIMAGLVVPPYLLYIN